MRSIFVAGLVLLSLTACQLREGNGLRGQLRETQTTVSLDPEQSATVVPAGQATSGAALSGYTPGDQLIELEHDGLLREATLHLPPDYSGEALPLVLVIHGGGGNMDGITESTQFSPLADMEGFAVLYPQGVSRIIRAGTWNGAHCCGYAHREGIDDVGFLVTLIERLIDEGLADPERIYATGMSNGGIMSYRLGAEHPEFFAAIAPVAGAIGGQQTPASPFEQIVQPAQALPILITHGLLDTNVMYVGGETQGLEKGRIDMSVAEAATFWATANSCDAEPQIETSADGTVTTATYQNCEATVILITVNDGGHSWPGSPAGRRGDPPSQSFDATAAIWDFFQQHSR